MIDLNQIKFTALFFEGLLSFLSPCVLPILPVYFGILTGGESGQATRKHQQLRYTLSFVLGIAVTFFLLAFTSSLLSRFLTQHMRLLQIISGVMILVMGLYQVGWLRLDFLMREWSVRDKAYQAGQQVTPLVAFLMGFTFSFSWTPCIGPVLASVFLYASSHQGSMSLLLLLIYSLGFILPFIFLTFFAEKMLALFKQKQRWVQYTTKISGALLILIGLSIVMGWFGPWMLKLFY